MSAICCIYVCKQLTTTWRMYNGPNIYTHNQAKMAHFFMGRDRVPVASRSRSQPTQPVEWVTKTKKKNRLTLDDVDGPLTHFMAMAWRYRFSRPKLSGDRLTVESVSSAVRQLSFLLPGRAAKKYTNSSKICCCATYNSWIHWTYVIVVETELRFRFRGIETRTAGKKIFHNIFACTDVCRSFTWNTLLVFTEMARLRLA